MYLGRFPFIIKMDGLETIRRLRRSHPTLKIILLTAYLNETLHEAALAAGAMQALSKQISATELAGAIRKAANAPAPSP